METDTELAEEDLASARYEVQYPEQKLHIRNRYKDTALQIHKENCSSFRSSLLSFGGDRASMISSYGNTPTFMRRSISSAGVLEYSYEQTPAFRRSSQNFGPVSEGRNSFRSLSRNSKTEETDERNEDSQAHHQISESIKKIPEENMLKNHKSFQQYDSPPSIQLPTIASSSSIKPTKTKDEETLSENHTLKLQGINSPVSKSSNQDIGMTKIIQNLERTIQSIPEETSESNDICLPFIEKSNKANPDEDEFGTISLTSTGSVEGSISYNIDASGNYLYQRKTARSRSSHESKLLSDSKPKTNRQSHVDTPLLSAQASSPFRSKPPKPPPKPDFLLTSFALRKDADGKDTHAFGYQRTGLKTSSYMWSTMRRDSSVNKMKLLEKTVGENLLTTQPVIKSFAYVDSEVTSHAASNNSSRLCAVM